MKIKFMAICFLVISALFSCGRRGMQNSSTDKLPMLNSDSFSTLPDCNKTNLGQLAYLTKEQKIYFCSAQNTWEQIKLKTGESGKENGEVKNTKEVKEPKNGNESQSSPEVKSTPEWKSTPKITSHPSEAKTCLAELFYLAKHCIELEKSPIPTVDLISNLIVNQICPIFLNQIHVVLGKHKSFNDVILVEDDEVSQKYLNYLIPTYHFIRKKEQCVAFFVKNKAYHIQTFSSCDNALPTITHLQETCN